jgi:hypothetical protein
MGGGQIQNNFSNIGNWEKGSFKKEDDNKLLSEVTNPLVNNGKDDVVVQDEDGHRYSVSSEQIIFTDNKLPSANTNVNFIFTDGNQKALSGKVIYSDNEIDDKPVTKVKIYAFDGLGFSSTSDEKVKIREIRANVTDEMLKRFEIYSNLDSIILKTEDGKRIIFCADELAASEGYELPEVGQKVVIGGIEGEVSRIRTNYNEEIFNVASVGVSNFIGGGNTERFDLLDEISFSQPNTKKAEEEISK